MGTTISFICCCSRHTRIAATIEEDPSKLHQDSDEDATLGLEVKPFHLPKQELGKISVTDLYNVLNDVTRFSYQLHNPLYLLLLDTRPMGDYTTKHIQSAFHCTAITASVVNNKLKHFNHVILYGTTDNVDDNDQAQKAVHILEERRIDYDVLTGGYEEFLARFPFLCNEITVWAEVERERRFTIYPSLVLEDWLFQGNGTQATSENIINSIGITHIINISTEHHCSLPDVQYLNIRLVDDGKSKFIDHFVEVGEFIASAKQSNGKVLVHCNLGISRSSTATLAYMMLFEQCSLLDAFRCLRYRRPISSPNRGFLNQLSDLEYYLFGERLTDAHELWLAI